MSFLLSAGADPNVRNSIGHTPSDDARPVTLKLLREFAREGSRTLGETDSVFDQPTAESWSSLGALHVFIERKQLNHLRQMSESKGAFDPHSFLSTLSLKYVHKFKDGNRELYDPGPLSQLFSQTYADVSAMGDKVEDLMVKQSKNCASYESDYKGEVKTLKDKFEELQTSFKSLDTKINLISMRALRIGQRLETVDEEKKKAEQAHRYIRYIVALNREDTTIHSLFDLENVSHETALIIRDLHIISAELDTPRTMTVILSIQSVLSPMSDSAGEIRDRQRCSTCRIQTM